MDRIMKIIITENQYRTLLESNTESMQTLIEFAFDNVKSECENGTYTRSHRGPICDPLDIMEEIKVIEVSKMESTNHLGKDKIKIIRIVVNCYVDSLYEYNNLDDFIYELQYECRHIIGDNNLIIELNDVINKRTNFNW